MSFINKLKQFRGLIKTLCLALIFLFQYQNANSQISETAKNQVYFENKRDTVKQKKGTESFTQQLSLEHRPAHLIPTDPFYRTDPRPKLSTGFTQSGHLKYSFSLPKGSLGSQIFPHTHQGIGVAVFDFGNRQELGTPIAAYLFQRSEIVRISSSLSLDYEWNFGISTGWKPYDRESNPNNIIVGSRVNTYINLGTSLRWQLADRIAMTGGVDFTHFSNGNTEYPNAGVNLPGIKVGVIYDLTKKEVKTNEGDVLQTPKFPQHLSYDMVVFGSWRRKGVDFFGAQVASPYKYPVVGAYFAPMYNWGYRLRTGFSLDAIYDGSANLYTEDYIVGTEQKFFKPEWDHQAALGLSARVDYVMPIFTISAGIGTHILHKGGDLRGTYQAFALKIKTTRSSFIHIGYSIKDFQDPNYLMLGIGYRFNNKNPSLLSR